MYVVCVIYIDILPWLDVQECSTNIQCKFAAIIWGVRITAVLTLWSVFIQLVNSLRERQYIPI